MSVRYVWASHRHRNPPRARRLHLAGAEPGHTACGRPVIESAEATGETELTSMCRHCASRRERR